jgi:hypothetical protein
MKIKELFNLLSNFSEEYSNEFKKYLNSPYLVNNKALYKIYAEILNNLDLLINSEYEKLIKKLSKKLRLSNSTVIQRLSNLNKEVLKFYKIKSFLSDVEYSELSLNEYLLKNKNFNVLEKNLEKTNDLIYSSNKISDKHYWNSFNFHVLSCEFITNNVRFVDNINADNIHPHIYNGSLDLSLYCLIQQINLFVYNFSLNIGTGNYQKYHFPINIYKLLDEIDRTNLFNRPPERKIIYDLYKMLFFTYYKREDSENFINYKNCFNNTKYLLNKELINFHFNQLINYCIMKARLGEDKDFYLRQKAELLNEFVEQGYFNINNKEFLHATTYRNFILSAFSIGNFDLLKYFIDNNTSKLNTNDYNDMMNFGLIYYYYGMKNYDKVWECKKNIEVNNFIYRFDIRNIVLRIYFETGEYDKLLDSIHNYKKSIMDDKILNKSNKDSLYKLLKYLNKLIIIINNPNLNLQEETKFLFNLVEKEPTFALKKWLLEKLFDLSKSVKEEMTV